MAKSAFVHACGHSGTATGRNRRDADRLGAWYAREDCWECRKAAENAAAATDAEAAGLPGLTGTPKQIPYGTTLRARKMPELSKTVDGLRADVQSGRLPYVNLPPQGVAKLRDMRAGSGGRLAPSEQGELLDAISIAAADALESTDASFWIDLDTEAPAVMRHIVRRNLAPTVLPSSLLEA